VKEHSGQHVSRTASSLENVVNSCVQNDRAVGREDAGMIYKRYYGYLFAIALRYVKSREDAEELVNESFVRVFDKIRTFTGKGEGAEFERLFKAWMARICVNACIDYLRSKKVTQSLDDEESEIQVEDTLTTIGELLNAEDIMRLLLHLPDTQRTIFNLYEVEGYSHEEISQMLGMPASTSRTYLTRAKDKLRQLYLSRNLAERY
jgi:RNA polymerase sigma factor (sigma-70 family)